MEVLPNEKGFIKIGNGTLTLDDRESVQTKYNYCGKGNVSRETFYYV